MVHPIENVFQEDSFSRGYARSKEEVAIAIALATGNKEIIERREKLEQILKK